MPIKAKYNGSYKDITDLMNVDESIDYVLAKTSSSYKRVYTATRSIEDTPPTTFKSIKPGANLTDYRIYGQTSRNLFDAEIVQGSFFANDGAFRDATNRVRSNESDFIYLTTGTYTINADGVDDVVYYAYSSEDTSTFLYHRSMTSWLSLPCTFTVQTPCYFLFGFRLSDEFDIIPSDISNIMLNVGSTALPYEPYGESVGDRTGNLFDGEFLQGCWLGSDGTFQANSKWICTQKMPCKANTDYTFTFGIKSRWYGFAWYDVDGNYIESNGSTIERQSNIFTATSPANAAFMAVNIAGDHIGTAPLDIHPSDVTDLMLVEGSTPLPYEPYGYKVPMTVEGKNLLDYDTITHGYRIQWSSGANYADETAIMSDFISVSENSTYVTDTDLYWICYDANKQYIGAWNGSDIIKSGVDAINSMTAISPCKFIRILSFGRKIAPISSTTMLNCGSTALPYEPYHAPVTTPIYLPEPIKMVGDEAEYIDYGEQKQHRVRKNLVQTIATSQTINDITFTVNANGSVTCNGTNHGNNPIIFELNNPDVVFPEGVYITSGCPAGGSITGGYKIQYFNGSSWNYELGSGSTFTLSGNLKYRSRILISKDVTVTNLTFCPMLRLASIEDDTYEPYIENTDLDVTLPALPTLTGTNVLSVGTEVQPSKIDITGHIKTISGGS